MVYWRRRQPEPEARRLLGREPARLVSAHQGCPDLRLHQQSVQSQIRDRRHFLRYAIDGRGRDTERAERPPHGHAGAAALGLCGDARKTMNARVPPSSCRRASPRWASLSRMLLSELEYIIAPPPRHTPITPQAVRA